AAEGAPDYEAAEMYTRAFRVGALGRCWMQHLGPPDLSLAAEAATDEDASVVAELGCEMEMVPELQEVCRWWPRGRWRVGGDGAPPAGRPDEGLKPPAFTKPGLPRREETIIVDRACRQETLAYEMESHASGKRPDSPTDLVEEGELLLTLNIFYPVIFQKHKDYKPYQTVLVLGSQKLTELRDSISCVSDFQIGGEFSSQPDQAPEHISKVLHVPQGLPFLYIQSLWHYYADDLSVFRTIIEWSESHDRGYVNLQSDDMEEYTFNDLSLKIGFPYLFCHQGDCEHIIIITDIRLIHYDDCLDRSLYPLLIKKHWLCTRKCFVCKMYTARWVTNNDSLAPEDPCFFCDVCFQMLHYDLEGNKLGEFLAYPYVDPGIFN
ncbi:SNPC3 protein, partial [Eolophus roseicapillus]|nr:SNPC3 protein [Eolophus roseicapilla]